MENEIEKLEKKWKIKVNVNHIKNVCACCDQEFKNSLVHYIESGNYCNACLASINKREREMKEYSKEGRRKCLNALKM